jgi:diguanylate cyclase (GGDEF)-like protein
MIPVETIAPAGGAVIPDVDETCIEARVMVARIRVFTDRAVAGALSSPLGTLLLAAIMGPAAGWDRAAIWLCVINFGELLILGQAYRYRSSPPAEQGNHIWARRQIWANGLIGLAWGSSVWFFRVDDHFLLYLINLAVLVGVAALCVTIMSPFRSAVLLFAVGILLPPLAQVALIPGPYRIETAAGLAILFVLTLHYGRVLRQQLIDGLDSEQRSRALVEQLSQVRAELSFSNGELATRNAELAATLERVKELATRDELTGAFNRRYIVDQLERQLAAKVRHATAASVAMLDLDHFKKINDRYGHPVGDQALQETVRVIAAELREGDVLARFGGEEFLVLLPMTGLDAARLLAERLRKALASVVLVVRSDEVSVRASFGVAELGPGESVAGWLGRADGALYQAKERGRDCVVVAD